MTRQKIKCNDIAYRQGFIEVAAGIHARHINLEVWNVHPDVDLTDKSLDSTSIPDEACVANTEIELSLSQAKALVDDLRAAIYQIEQAKSDEHLPERSGEQAT